MHSDETARSLREAVRALVLAHGVLEDAKRPCGTPISVSHAYALLELLQHGAPMTVTELAQRLMIDRSNVSRLTERMQRAGDLVRADSLDDARARSLSLTPQGKRLARRVDRASLVHFSEIGAHLSVPPEQIVDALKALESAITRTVER